MARTEIRYREEELYQAFGAFQDLQHLSLLLDRSVLSGGKVNKLDEAGSAEVFLLRVRRYPPGTTAVDDYIWVLPRHNEDGGVDEGLAAKGLRLSGESAPTLYTLSRSIIAAIDQA